MAVNLLESLKKIGQSIKSLQNKKMSKEQLNNILNKSYYLVNTETNASDFTAGTNWSVTSGLAWLISNSIVVHTNCKRSSATGSGNISDQLTCSFTIDDERITYIPPYWGALTYVTGVPVHGAFKCTSTSNPWQCQIYLTETHAATQYARFRFQIPVTIDVTKY